MEPPAELSTSGRPIRNTRKRKYDFRLFLKDVDENSNILSKSMSSSRIQNEAGDDDGIEKWAESILNCQRALENTRSRSVVDRASPSESIINV